VPGAKHISAVNVCACPTSTFANGGEIEFGVAQEIVTAAVANFDGSAALVAVTLTVAGDGALAGAVYVAASAPELAIVPNIAFPPATPFTLQFTVVAGLPLLPMFAVKP
jgi:hypothetical protein